MIRVVSYLARGIAQLLVRFYSGSGWSPNPTHYNKEANARLYTNLSGKKDVATIRIALPREWAIMLEP